MELLLPDSGRATTADITEYVRKEDMPFEEIRIYAPESERLPRADA